MTLAEWMTQHAKTPEALAEELGVHWATIYKWRARTAFPRVAQLAALERITDGKVTARDFMPEPVPISPPAPAPQPEQAA